MKKIIRHGRKPEKKFMRFECSKCHCIFECSEDEWCTECDGNRVCSWTTCPECGGHVWRA